MCHPLAHVHLLMFAYLLAVASFVWLAYLHAAEWTVFLPFLNGLPFALYVLVHQVLLACPCTREHCQYETLP